MAITFYTGIPRSGKSLFAVAKIYNTFVPPKLTLIDEKLIESGLKSEFEYQYEVCYTNIMGFKFEISERIKLFDFEICLKDISLLHQMYLNKSSDFELNEKAKELGLYKALFVIDEAQNVFRDKSAAVLVWWLTYHAHMYQDIILITQDLALISNEYKRLGEFFFRAVPQRLRLKKSVQKYRQYSSYSMYQKDYINTISLKALPVYFTLYVSGSQSKDKSIALRFVWFALIAVLCTIASFYYAYDSFSSSSGGDASSIEGSAPVDEKKASSSSYEVALPAVSLNKKLYKFQCFETMCYFKDKKNTKEVPYSILISLIPNLDSSNSFNTYVDGRLTMYFFAESDVFAFLVDVDAAPEDKEKIPEIKAF